MKDFFKRNIPIKIEGYFADKATGRDTEQLQQVEYTLQEKVIYGTEEQAAEAVREIRNQYPDIREAALEFLYDLRGHCKP